MGNFRDKYSKGDIQFHANEKNTDGLGSIPIVLL